jgi:lipid-A-disaccharide synthase-like uncharacterized protein
MVGLLLILAGWIYEFWQTLKSRRAGVPLSFALLYGAGSLLLTLHSMQLGDTVFIILNGAATMIAAANAVFALTRGKEGKGGAASGRGKEGKGGAKRARTRKK